MTPEKVIASSLPEVPPAVEDDHGHPRFGTYVGELPEVALRRLKGPYQLPRPLRLLKHKKWQYAQVVTPDVVAVMAIADFGYTANAFFAALDLRTRRVAFDEGFLGLPGTRVKVSDAPGPGLHALFRRPGTRFSIDREHDTYSVDLSLGSPLPLVDTVAQRSGLDGAVVRALIGDGVLGRGARLLGLDGGVRWSGELQTEGAAPALTVISPVGGDGILNVTQKRCGLGASGSLRIGRNLYTLDGGVAGIDYTHGYLARHTAWRWAMGNGRLSDGTALGFNLVEGFNDASPRCNENALWFGDRLIPLDRARFEFDKGAPERPWKISTRDGALSLSFQPLHLHREERDYKVVRSHFVQPLGLFSGTLRIDGRAVIIEDVGGVTEDQDILW
ncbi:MAG: DUF2804 domain-containing protein [Myxococcaceae bacterium]|nr:DUF2804 domain-containing protein [Myxococcaceae bacterium]